MKFFTLIESISYITTQSAEDGAVAVHVLKPGLPALPGLGQGGGYARGQRPLAPARVAVGAEGYVRIGDGGPREAYLGRALAPGQADGQAVHGVVEAQGVFAGRGVEENIAQAQLRDPAHEPYRLLEHLPRALHGVGR